MESANSLLVRHKMPAEKYLSPMETRGSDATE